MSSYESFKRFLREHFLRENVLGDGFCLFHCAKAALDLPNSKNLVYMFLSHVISNFKIYLNEFNVTDMNPEEDPLIAEPKTMNDFERNIVHKILHQGWPPTEIFIRWFGMMAKMNILYIQIPKKSKDIFVNLYEHEIDRCIAVESDYIEFLRCIDFSATFTLILEHEHWNILWPKPLLISQENRYKDLEYLVMPWF